MVVLVAGWTAAIVSSQELVIADQGKSEFVIVVGQKASPSEQHGAEELQMFLQQMTGAKLPLKDDSGPVGPHEIILGDNAHLRQLKVKIDFDQLGKEGYTIRTVGPHLVIAGGKLRGTMYGVYGLLEDHLGCRWFTAKVSRIPKKDRLVLPPLDDTQIPVLEYREPFVRECFDGDWAARNRVNSNRAALEAKHGGKVSYYGFVHTFNRLLPPEKYFDEHPEYYSLRNGKRIKDHTQLCCTNEDVIRLVTEQVLKDMRAHPEATVHSVSQNDWGNWCECDKCRAIAEQEGSQIGPILYLVNRVAEAVEKEFPDKAIDTLAYHYSRKPPKTMRPRQNVIIRLCSIECCFSHPLATCDSRENRKFRDDIIGWSKMSNRLWVWDYTTSFAHYLVPFPNLRVLNDNIKFFKDHSVTGIFEEDNYTSVGGEFSELGGYMMAKFLWNPDYDEDTAMNEFLEGVYGAAAGPIRQYIDLLHDKVANENIHMHIWEGPRAKYLTDDIVEQSVQLWNRAEQAVADQPEVLERVKLARLPVDYVWLDRAQVKQDQPFRIEGDRYVTDVDAEYAQRARNFFDVIARNKVTAIDEGRRKLEPFRNRVLPRAEGYPIVSLANKALRLQIVPLLGGRFIGLHSLPKKTDICYHAAPGAPGYPNAGGYEESWKGGHHGPGWAKGFDAKVTQAERGTQVAMTAELTRGVRLNRVVTLPPEGNWFEIESRIANNSTTKQSGALRTRFDFDLGNTDDLTAVVPGKGENPAFSLALPAEQAEENRSFPGAQLAQGITLANHKLGLGVRLLPSQAELERGWIRYDARAGRVTLELKTKGELEPKTQSRLVQRYEVLTDLAGVPEVKGRGAQEHRALRVVCQEDLISIGRYGTWAWIEEDPTAEDGFSAHMAKDHYEWCCQWRYSPSQFEPNTKYDVFARVRVAKKGEGGWAFWAGVYDTVNKRGLGQIKPNTKDIKDSDWHLYKLATVTPAQGHYVWIGPPKNPENVDGVWLDYFELRAVKE